MLSSNIPYEILRLVIQALERQELKHARLVCRSWERVATKCLFDTIIAYPNRQSLEMCKAVSGQRRLHRMASCAVIKSFRGSMSISLDTGWMLRTLSLEDEEHSRLGDQDCSTVYEIINEICGFRSLQGAVIEYTDNYCTQRFYFYKPGLESVRYRFNLLNRLFQALDTRIQNPDLCNVTSLTILNLHNMPHPTLTASRAFKNVVSHVKRLHLEVTEDCCEDAPDRDIYLEERRTFIPHLRDHWLGSVAAQLRSLTVCFQDCWGPFPGYFDGKDLEMPELHTLALGHYAIAHHNDLDWGLRQTSIQALQMYSCPIVSHIKMGSRELDGWNVQTHDWIRIRNKRFGWHCEGDQVFHFPGSWEEIFTRIQTELSNLKSFRSFSCLSRPADDWQLSSASQIEYYTSLRPDRYVRFDSGLLPSQWINPKPNGNFIMGHDAEPINVHGLNRERNMVALSSLRTELQRRSMQLVR